MKPNDDEDLETFTARVEREQRKLEDAVRERALTALAAAEQP